VLLINLLWESFVKLGVLRAVVPVVKGLGFLTYKLIELPNWRVSDTDIAIAMISPLSSPLISL
jgi:hypothetical protein